MAGRVGVDLEARSRRRILSTLHEGRAGRDRLLVRVGEVVDHQVEVDLLLLGTAGPFGPHMVRRELHREVGIAVDQHGVPVVVSLDLAVEQAGPEAADGVQIGGVQNNGFASESHAPMLAGGYDSALRNGVKGFRRG